MIPFQLTISLSKGNRMRNFVLGWHLAACIAVAALVAAPTMATPASAGSQCCCCKPSKPKVHRVVPRLDATGHDRAWMQRQGFRTCSQVLASCRRGANKPGHGLAYAGVCEDRFQTCLRTGTWSTTNTGSVSGLVRQ